MAYRISATTDEDQRILQAVRDMAWTQRRPVSEVMREAFIKKVWGTDREYKEWLDDQS